MGSWSALSPIFQKASEAGNINFNQNAYWFIAEPSSVALPSGPGLYIFTQNSVPGDNVLAFQGEYNSSLLGGSATTYGITSIDAFEFDIDLNTGAVSDGYFEARANDVLWEVSFEGGAGAVSGPYINMYVSSGTLTDVSSIPVPLLGAVTGDLKGYFVGASNPNIVLGFTMANTTALLDKDHVLVGTMLVEGNGVVGSAGLTLPDSSLETHNIDWGTWNNPIEDNWVVVNAVVDGVELQTSNHLAMVTPTDIANLTGTGSYGSSAASAFIGSGSAGDVTQVVAGMNVDFNTGAISNGSLQVEVAGSQAWEIDFAGSIANGLVDLNSIAGTLSDPGGLISSSIDANLGGVFTGAGAEAFVGGFDLVDDLNRFNQVDGLYTVER